MSHISTSARSATWGDDLVLELFHSGGGLKGAVDRIRDVVGPIVGTRNTFAKLLRTDSVDELDEAERLRAWLLLTTIGTDPSTFGIDDEAVPRAFDVERLRDELYTTRDLNPEPAGSAFGLVLAFPTRTAVAA